MGINEVHTLGQHADKILFHVLKTVILSKAVVHFFRFLASAVLVVIKAFVNVINAIAQESDVGIDEENIVLREKLANSLGAKANKSMNKIELSYFQSFNCNVSGLENNWFLVNEPRNHI